MELSDLNLLLDRIEKNIEIAVDDYDILDVIIKAEKELNKELYGYTKLNHNDYKKGSKAPKLYYK